jgi:biopolymer transport protein ExbD
MKTPRIPEVNTGSTVDIAFLLLVFFLLVTTMETEEGIARKMPQKSKIPLEVEYNERDVLEVLLNGKDELLVDGEVVSPEDLPMIVTRFMTNPLNENDLPQPEFVTREICLKELQSEKSKNDIHEKEFWENRLLAVKLTGPQNFPSRNMVIVIQNDNGTSYSGYISVQNTIELSVEQLRNEWSQKLFAKSYEEIKNKPENDEQIRVLKALVPNRIVEREPKNIAMY